PAAGAHRVRARGGRPLDRGAGRWAPAARRSRARRAGRGLRPADGAGGADDATAHRGARARRPGSGDGVPAGRARPPPGGAGPGTPGGGGVSASLEISLVKLYLDRDARHAFLADPRGAATAAGLGADDVAALERIDRDGLELAAHSFERKRSRAPRPGLAARAYGWWRRLPGRLTGPAGS